MQNKEFKSFYKEVKGNEGNKCHYPTRLDTYGCGCQHDCSYCYAKSLLSFRNLWDFQNPAIANIDKIRNKVKKLPDGMPTIRLGGMTDCFQPLELEHRVTYNTIAALNEKKQPYLIVTKSDIVAYDEYLALMDKELAHIQVTITCFDDDLYHKLAYEKACPPSKRIQAVEKLYAAGFDVQVRLSPFIPEFVDYEILSEIKCDKLIVEFLRVNTWVKKWFNIDFAPYTVKQGGYNHLPLEVKKEYISKIHGFSEVSVCEDEDAAYKYWNYYFNPNPYDCCNLRGSARPVKLPMPEMNEQPAKDQITIFDVLGGTE